MPRRPNGFTFIELMVVFVIIGIIFTIAMPKFTSAVSSSARRSAARTTAALVSQARALAIQNGRLARFARNGNQVAVLLQGPNGAWQTMASRDLTSQGVSVTTSPTDVIEFDSRGIVTDGTIATRNVYITRDGLTDTVCVVGLGKVAVNQCTLVQ
jgi:type II secretion system protein H